MKRILLASALLAGLAAAGPAQAQWHGGYYGGWHGGIGVIAPPIVIAPPVYVAPPPVYYAPPPVYAPAPAYGQSCYAGNYVCPVQPSPLGAPCSCPVNGYSRIGGTVGN